ncbi:MAG: SDR family oxidoreductase, partial [Proteobacteria bacterium]|nr:SDR family oxidoreductase [Pseudomonadota bacterium]
NHEPAGPASPFKSALFLNGDTPLAGAIRTFLLSRGLKLAVYSQAAPEGSAPPHASPGAPDGARRYGPADAGPLSEACLQHILDDFGPVDLVIHDLGTGTVSPPREDGSGGQRLEANLRGALDLAPHLEAKMAEFGRGRILYLAPWAWDVHVDSLWYQSVKTGTASLAKAMARRLSASRVTVNCLIPGFVGGLIPLGARSSAGVPEFGKRLKRDVEISELLKLVGFLLSEDSQCLTGQVLETGGLNG